MQDRNEVQKTQLRPTAGIWACPNCGRRIQVITDSEWREETPFRCVCGADMVPNEEHAEVPQQDDEGLPGRPPFRAQDDISDETRIAQGEPHPD